MKKPFILLILLLLLTGCGAKPQPVKNEPMSGYPKEESQAMQDKQDSESMVSNFLPSEGEDNDSHIYEPVKGMSPNEIVEAFFAQEYISYRTFKHIDISAIIDMRANSNQSMVNWSKMLTQRRKLISENNFCYVETEEFPYTIVYEDEADDQRMDEWEKWLTNPKNMVIHFRIKGEEGKAYPPFMAMNSLHSVLLKRIDGEWKISMHYFPGSRRKYGMGMVVVPSEEEMLADLELEFAYLPEPASDVPSGSKEYDAKAAAEYALKYTEVKNPDYYDIGDWIGNCANFISQSVWAGFGASGMTSEWYDGSPAWNHVGYFWEYITRGHSMVGQQLKGVSGLKSGDIIQTRSLLMEDNPGRFTHELMVVDGETLTLAQNTPAAFVYYSDLVNVQTRMIRPLYLK